MSTTNTTPIHIRLRSTRKDRGLTMRQLAKVLEVHPKTLGPWEKGTDPITPHWQERIEQWIETGEISTERPRRDKVRAVLASLPSGSISSRSTMTEAISAYLHHLNQSSTYNILRRATRTLMKFSGVFGSNQMNGVSGLKLAEWIASLLIHESNSMTNHLRRLFAWLDAQNVLTPETRLSLTSASLLKHGQGGLRSPLGMRVLTARKKAGITREELGQQLGTSVSRIEIHGALPVRIVPALDRWLTDVESEHSESSESLSIGDRLYEARVVRRIGLGDLASLFQVHYSTVAAWERGRHNGGWDVPEVWEPLVERWIESGLPPSDAEAAQARASLLSKRLPALAKLELPTDRAPRTLREIFEAYLCSLPDGGLEQCTLRDIVFHERLLCTVFGESFELQTLKPADLQRYIQYRTKGCGFAVRKVAPTTIKKPLTTLRTVWNWAVNNGHLTGRFPNYGLKYPKGNEKPGFHAWKEIERRIARGGLSQSEKADMWSGAFLTLSDIEELLAFVKQQARHPVIYPMFAFAAHTGCRRSEMLRSRISHIDLEARVVTIHERKRVHTMFTTRIVPISPFLFGVLKEWFDNHPGGIHTFCVTLIHRSRKERKTPQPLTPNEATDQFRRTLAGSKWSMMRGWHVFRHSFCSNCAAKGIDQRIINAWVGHQTEEMVRRYRHLIPGQQQDSIIAVFGGGREAVPA